MNRPTVFITSCDGNLFSVDVAFLSKCPHPHLESTYTLINDFKMVSFLHNLVGPAVNGSGYFLLGESVSEKEFRIKSFSSKLNEILDE